MVKKRSHGEGSITKVVRQGRPYYRVRLRSDGKTYETLVRSREKGKRRLVEFQRVAGLGSGATMPLGDFLRDEWLPSLLVSDATLKGYETQVRLRIEPHLGDVTLHRLDVGRVERAYAAMRRAGVTASQLHHTHVALSSALSTAVRWGYMTSNPAQDSNYRREWQPKDPQPLTAKQAKALLDAAEPEWYPFCVLLLTTGLRWSEVQRLEWGMVDLEQGTLRPPGTKTKKARQAVPLTDLAVRALQQQRRQQAEALLRAGTSSRPRLVFTAKNDAHAPLSHGTAIKAWRRQCRAAGVPEVRVHDARHSVGSALAAMGVSQRVVMDVLRHSNISMSAWYSQQSDETVRAALQLLDAVFQSD